MIKIVAITASGVIDITEKNSVLAMLDGLTRGHTAFLTFQELLEAHGGYFPTLYTRVPGRKLLADAYDHYQAARGDSRRAHRVEY